VESTNPKEVFGNIRVENTKVFSYGKIQLHHAMHEYYLDEQGSENSEQSLFSVLQRCKRIRVLRRKEFATLGAGNMAQDVEFEIISATRLATRPFVCQPLTDRWPLLLRGSQRIVRIA
jgi:hypothetical protein